MAHRNPAPTREGVNLSSPELRQRTQQDQACAVSYLIQHQFAVRNKREKGSRECALESWKHDLPTGLFLLLFTSLLTSNSRYLFLSFRGLDIGVNYNFRFQNAQRTFGFRF